MANEEALKKIENCVVMAESWVCECDPDVGWQCERCAFLSSLYGARRLLTPATPDAPPLLCVECGEVILPICEACAGDMARQ